jgi:hypothetical protein
MAVHCKQVKLPRRNACDSDAQCTGRVLGVITVDSDPGGDFHLAPKYEGGPDFGGVFVMNPQTVYLTGSEYQEMINAIKANL